MHPPRNAKGRYCVQLSFIDNQIPILESSRSQAVSRFLQIVREFSSNLDLQKQMRQQLMNVCNWNRYLN